MNNNIQMLLFFSFQIKNNAICFYELFQFIFGIQYPYIQLYILEKCIICIDNTLSITMSNFFMLLTLHLNSNLKYCIVLY